MLKWHFICAIVLISNIENVASLFKMTNVECRSFNESWVLIQKCRLHAVSRGIVDFNMNIKFLKPAFVIHLNVASVKKYNTYKPSLINVTVDACEYIKKRNNPAVNLIYKVFKEFSNINHSCPYMGDQILDGFHLRHDLLNLPLPTGKYGVLFTWYLHRQKAFVTNVYFDFVEKN